MHHCVFVIVYYAKISMSIETSQRRASATENKVDKLPRYHDHLVMTKDQLEGMSQM